MRIALMTREFPPHVYGGAGVHVEYLSKELAKLAEVSVYCWGEQQSPDTNPAVFGQQAWAEITDGSTGKFKTALEAMSLNLTQVKDLHGIDVIHTHTWYVSMAGFLAQKLYNIPFVLTTHSLEPLRAWKAEQLGSGYTMSSWMERTAIDAADAVIAVSEGTKADILQAYPEIDAAKIHVIYNGIDLAEYQKTDATDALVKYGIDPAIPYVLFVGRITRQKGVTHLVDALQYLPEGTQVVLCAGAPDTPEIEAEMRAMVEKARARNPLVTWVDHMITKQEAIQLYSNCAVFCCPSVYEPFGIINLEAMACKAPVVASATGGILEVVVDGETGYLVPFDQDPTTKFPSNPEQFAKDLAAKLNILLADSGKAKLFGEAGRRRVEARFAWSAIAEQTLELYKSLADARKS